MWFFLFLMLFIRCFHTTHALSHERIEKLYPEFNFRTYNSNDSRLIFAHVIFRHGDRNIKQVYPNDPYKDESHWPGGYGGLTNEGKRQQYRLGQYFRRRYGEIISEKYSLNEIYVQSTDYDRTIMSAQVNLAGLYPPTNDAIWNDDIFWQPIPVHTTPSKYDHALYGPDNCPQFSREYEKYEKESSEAQRIRTEYKDLFSFWSEKCGLNLITINDVTCLYRTLYIEYLHEKPLADWALEALKPNGVMEQIAVFYYKMCSNNKKLARCQSGFLIKEMFERFGQKNNSTLTPDRSLWLYSAHDLTITNMLNSLGLLEPHIPPYAASLHFELYKMNENEHYIQIFYRKSNEEDLSPMSIPNCGEKCTLDQLYELYGDIIPEDYDLECGLRRGISDERNELYSTR